MSLRSCIPLNVKRRLDVPSGLGLNFSTKMTYFSQAVLFGCPVGFRSFSSAPTWPWKCSTVPTSISEYLEPRKRRQSKTRSVCKLQVTYGVIFACKQVANPCFVPYPSVEDVTGGCTEEEGHKARTELWKSLYPEKQNEANMMAISILDGVLTSQDWYFRFVKQQATAGLNVSNCEGLSPLSGRPNNCKADLGSCWTHASGACGLSRGAGWISPKEGDFPKIVHLRTCT